MEPEGEAQLAVSSGDGGRGPERAGLSVEVVSHSESADSTPRSVHATASERKECFLEMKGSVYNYMMVLPPLANQRFGHYLTKDVCTGFLMFAICIMLQLSLTLIAGAHILSENRATRMKLIQQVDDPSHTYLAVMGDWMEKTKTRSKEHNDDFMVHIANQVDSMITGDSEPEGCCRGSDCAGFLVKCCVPNASGSAKSLLAGMPPRQKESARRAPLDSALMPFLQLRGRRPGGGGGGSGGGGGHGAGHSHKSRKKNEDSPPKLEPACVLTQGVISCLSPSAGVLSLWGDLDANGDGIWSLHEAEMDATNLGCHLGTPLVDLFRSACNGLQQDAWDTADSGNVSRADRESRGILPPEVWKLEAIPFPYFEWWRGLVGICQHGTETLCPDLVMRGTFSGLLHESRAFLRGGVTDLDSLLKYCRRLLKPGGICDDALPGTYAVFQERMKETCGTSVRFQGPRYQNPHKANDALPLMATTFTTLQGLQYIHSHTFHFFMWLIIIMWYINLLGELQELVHFWDFLSTFPVKNEWPFLTPEMRRKLRTMSWKTSSWKSSFGSAKEQEQLEQQDSSAATSTDSGQATPLEPPPQHGQPGVEADAGEADAEVTAQRSRESNVQAQAPAPILRHASSGLGVRRHLSEARPLLTPVPLAKRFLTTQSTRGASFYQTEGQDSHRSEKTEGSLYDSCSGLEQIHITEIARPHYIICIVMATMRSIILVVLAYAGTFFLLSNHTLLDLLLNALALAFILELDEFIFDYVVPTEGKELLDKLAPLKYRSRLHDATGFPGLCAQLLQDRPFWGLLVIPVVAFCVVAVHDYEDVQPMLEALNCLCLKKGERCLADSMLQQTKWDQHWSIIANLPHLGR